MGQNLNGNNMAVMYVNYVNRSRDLYRTLIMRWTRVMFSWCVGEEKLHIREYIRLLI